MNEKVKQLCKEWFRYDETSPSGLVWAKDYKYYLNKN